MKKKLKRSRERIKQFWRIVKNCKGRILATIRTLEKRKNDIRPYAEISINGGKHLGLLDSGAQISCLGNSWAKKTKTELKPNTNFSIITADGNKQMVIGQENLEVEFQGQIKNIKFYVIPSIKQEIILGMDFWEAFHIRPQYGISSLEIDDESEEKIQLNDEQWKRLDAAKNKFPSFEKEGLGKTAVIEHIIELEPNTKPIKQRYYPISPAIEKLVHEEVDNMLKMGVIEEAPNSPWSSPVVLVKKPNKLRLCLDSRKVNSFTIKDAYPLPHIEGVFSRMPKAKFISSLDLSHAFWQIPLAENSRDYTCFTIPNRPLYRYCVMPFGLCNAPQSLCRLMDKVIPPQLRQEVFVYLDDLLILSEEFDRHIELLTEVASCLRKAGLTIKLEKSKFCLKEIKYLGFIVGDGILKIDPEKVECVVNFPVPKSVKQLRRFLGMAGWYRRFVENFSEITAPLTHLLKKSKTFGWNEEAQQAFDKLKDTLITAPVLVNPDYSKPFIIQCDASKLGVGAVLAQKDEEGIERPIAYFSRKTNKAQSNYSVTELECLAAVLSLQKFRAYVEGQEFTIITDHSSLQWLMNQSDLSGRLARWSLKIQRYKFTIEHRKGTQNVVPDCLSRQYDTIAALEYFPIIDLKAEAFKETEYEKLKSTIVANANSLPDLKIIDEHVYKRVDHESGDPSKDMFNWKLWVPKKLINEVIVNAHAPPNKSHGGIAKTLEYVRKNLFWPNMANDVRQVIENCEDCKKNKPLNTITRPPMTKHYIVDRPFQKLYVDLLGPYPRSKQGFTGIFIVLDAFSKFVFLKPLKKFTAEPLCQFLRESVFSIFGTPEIVFSDNGKQFKSNQFSQLLKARGIKQHFTALYNPQANASERVNRSIITAIRSYVKQDQREWDKFLPEIAEALRSSYHQTIKGTPYFCLFGQQMVTHAEDYTLIRKLQGFDKSETDRNDKLSLIRKTMKDEIAKAFENSSQRYNLRARDRQLSIGDTVYRRNFILSQAAKNFTAKFAPKFVKATIIKQHGTNMYELKDVETGKTGIYQLKDIKSTNK